MRLSSQSTYFLSNSIRAKALEHFSSGCCAREGVLPKQEGLRLHTSKVVSGYVLRFFRLTSYRYAGALGFIRLLLLQRTCSDDARHHFSHDTSLAPSGGSMAQI
jgi:hypothetical protein